jgi:hypothetical protein
MGTRLWVRLLTSFGGRAAEYSGTGHAVYGGMSLKIRASLLLTVKIRQPSHEFTFGVGISFIPYPLVLTPVV